MVQSPSAPIAAPRRLAMLTAVALIALTAAGCLKKDGGDITGSIGPTGNSAESWRAYADQWGKRYDEKPGDKTASLNYARARIRLSPALAGPQAPS